MIILYDYYKELLTTKQQQYFEGYYFENESLQELSENYEVIGDGHLVNREDNYPDVANNFLLLKDQWKKADNVHLVTPEYLKANEAYLVK